MRRSTVKILFATCVLAAAGSVLSIICTAISWWLTGSGYIVTPGGAF